MKRLILPMLLVLQPLLALALAALWFTPQGEPRVQPWQAPSALLPELPPPVIETPAQDDQEQLAIIRQRPLFASNRRPPEPPKPPPPPDPLDKTQINGILNGDVTVVLATVDGQSRRLLPKAKVGAWELLSVTERSVTFVNADKQRQLPLRYVSLRDPRLPAATSGSSRSSPAARQRSAPQVTGQMPQAPPSSSAGQTPQPETTPTPPQQ